MKIVFMGTPIFGKIVLKQLHQKYNVSLVVTQPDKKIGRKQTLSFSPVKEYAINEQLEIFQPISMINDYREIIKLNPDLIITAAYGQMIPKEIIERFRCLNIHGSILPKHRGGAPIQRAIMNGDLKTGVTLMYMANEMDSGDIIDFKEIIIKEDDTTSILMEKLAYLGAELLLNNIEDIIKDKAPRIAQDHSQRTFSYNLTKEDELLNFHDSTFKVIRKLNSLLDEPGASFIINNIRIKVYNMKKSDIITSAKCGEVISISPFLTIQTNDGAVDILELQEQGKKRMNIKNYLNGQRLIKKGDVVNV